MQLAVDSLTTACKCHGVSGSCSMRTCWKSLPDLRSVAVTMLDRYSFAVEVAYKRVSRRPRKSTKSVATVTTSLINAVTSTPPVKRLVPVMHRRRTLNDTDIAYYTMSPDYCLPDASLGSVGTKDRYFDNSWLFVFSDHRKIHVAGTTLCPGKKYTKDTIE